MNTNNNFLERCVPVYIMGENGPLSKTPYGYFKGQSKLQGTVQVGQPLILGGLKGKVKVQALRFAKRRNVLEEELGKVGEELAKIEGIQSQVSSALDELEKQEAAAIASFQQEGGSLQAGIARLTAERSSLESSLSDELRVAYQQTAARSGGVAVGRLMDGRCGVCRNVIDGGRLIDLKTQAPLGTCPHCKRLLVVA